MHPTALRFWTKLQGYLAHKKYPPPQGYRRALGIFLVQGLGKRKGVVMSEVPLYPPPPSPAAPDALYLASDRTF